MLGSGQRADLHLGRMTLDLGSRRLIARNKFRNTTNAFDGVHLSLGDPARARARAFYVLGLHDRLGSGASLARRYHTVGARALRRPEAARFDYELELAGQFGARTVARAGVRTRLDHEAFTGHAELGYTFAAPWSPRLVAQLDYASGSADPDADESGTFDPLFGARRGDLVATGIYGPFRRANLVSPGLRLHVTPRPDVKAWLKIRHWRLAQEKDAFVGSGLADPTGGAGDRLGTDHWWKGSYLDDVPPPAAGAPSADDSDYFYLNVRFRI